MKASTGSGAANNAAVATDESVDSDLNRPAERRPRGQRTEKEQEYLDAVADEAEAGVEAVESQIRDLQASLKERKAAAKQSRAAAKGEGINS